MAEWINSHNEVLQVILNALMVLIWIFYLQIFLFSFLRSRRPEILITLGAGAGLKARCFVTNLGLEPIYILDILVDLETDEEMHRAIITDRTELSDQELNDPTEATNQGPLESGKFMDIGNFETLVRRAGSSGPDLRADGDVRSIKILVIAATSAKWSLIGAERKYNVTREGDRLHLRATTITAHQIQSRRGERRLHRQLASAMAPQTGI